MTEGINHSANAPPMLAVDRGLLRRPGRNRLSLDRVWIVDDEQESSGGAADHLWDQAISTDADGSDPKDGVVDGQLRDDVFTLTDPVQHTSAER